MGVRELEDDIDNLKREVATASQIALHNARPSWPKVILTLLGVVFSAGGIVWTLSAQVANKASTQEVEDARRSLIERIHQLDNVNAQVIDKLAAMQKSHDEMRTEIHEIRNMLSFGPVRRR